MEQKIDISVIVPVYNVELYLNECVESVLNQTFNNFELILVDDGSTDNSGLICDSLAKRDNRIVVFHKENGKQLQTRVFGINKARGEYFVFLDADDYLELNTLEKVKQTFDKYNCDCVVYGYNVVKNGAIIKKSDNEEFSPLYLDKKREIWLKMLCDGYHSMWRKAVKRSLIGKFDFSNYYDITKGEDLIHSLEIYQNIRNCVFLSDKYYNYRVNDDSVTHLKIKFEDLKADFRGREIVVRFLKNQNCFTADDWEKYRYHAVMQFVGYLLLVVRTKSRIKKKKEHFELIYTRKYFTDFINKKFDKSFNLGKNGYIFNLFRNRKYNRLIIFVKLYYFIKSCLWRRNSE